MKFSEISKEKWDELRPYLDTCLLPVTGMSGEESPYEATDCLERLRDMMDLIEQPFKGRVVTYPACHYVPEDGDVDSSLTLWCHNLKRSGFKYVVVITASAELSITCESADLILCPISKDELPSQEEVSALIRELWSGTTS